MLRNATRLLATATVALVLAAGPQPAHAAAVPVEEGTNGFLCKLFRLSCP